MNDLKPKNSKEILGNQPSIDILRKWLSSYDLELKKEIDKKVDKKKEKKEKSFQRAAMISGPVGIGHTLITELLAKELNYKIIMFDCSNCKATKPKTKDPLDSVDYISDIQVSKSFFKKMIVFDTGSVITGTMSTQIIALIKKSKVPIIINCNDPYDLRTLSNYCLHIKLKRPTKIQIINYLIDKKLISPDDKESVLTIVEKQGGDVRHIVNSFQYGIEPSKDINGQMNLFSATEKIFNSESYPEKEIAFWEDYSMVPLMVQQNYIKEPKYYEKYSKKEKLETLESIANGSEALSDYACINDKTGPGSWSLLPICAALIIRATFLSKKLISPFPGPKFPDMLGKGSRERSSRDNLVYVSKGIKINPVEFRLTYLPFLYTTFMNHLQDGSKESIEKAFKLLMFFKISRDSFFDVIEKVYLENIEIPSKNKSAFTRFYNKKIKN